MFSGLVLRCSLDHFTIVTSQKIWSDQNSFNLGSHFSPMIFTMGTWILFQVRTFFSGHLYVFIHEFKLLKYPYSFIKIINDVYTSNKVDNYGLFINQFNLIDLKKSRYIDHKPLSHFENIKPF